jgi:hypothetical protein
MTANAVLGMRGYLTWRATLSSKPAAVMHANSELPPDDTNGKVSPVTGMTPLTPPMLITACTAIGERDLDTEVREQQERADHRDDADETELLSDDGEDEVAVGQR